MFKKAASEAAVRRTLRRIRSSTFVRAGELVSRRCLEARRTHLTLPSPKRAETRSFPYCTLSL